MLVVVEYLVIRSAKVEINLGIAALTGRLLPASVAPALHLTMPLARPRGVKTRKKSAGGP